MCGIVGFLSPLGEGRPSSARLQQLEEMIDLVGHRGPDEAGLFLDDHAALGVARLQVVDLAGGVQPIGDPSGRWWIAYNGEVFNYQELRAELGARGHHFETRCDTEVVLHAWMEWGPASLERLNGGFAFVIYDRRERVAVLARDRFGKRPLYYRQSGDRLEFGSEMKAFLAGDGAGLEWDSQALSSTFAHWTFVDGETPFRGVRQLRAGSLLRVDRDGSRESRYAAFPLRTVGRPALSFDAAVDELQTLLRSSVQRRLPGEVKLAILLSGGLDSAIITHLVRRHQSGYQRTFSVGFEEAEFDESAEQDQVAAHLGVDNTRIRIDGGSIVEAFPLALWHSELPQFRMAFVPLFLLAREIAGEGFRVVLSGEGADEVFLGYDIFKETRLRQDWQKLTSAERRGRLRVLYPYMDLFQERNISALVTVFERSLSDPGAPLFSHDLRLQNGHFACRLLRSKAEAPARLIAAMGAQVSGADPVSRAQWLEVQTLLQGYLLSSQGDRMMFAHGIEPRNPFLDRELVDFAATLPENYLLGEDGLEKRLLKRAYADDLPQPIIQRPKQPYRSPGVSAFFDQGGELRAEWSDRLSDEALSRVDALDAAFAKQLVARIRSAGPGRISPRLDQAFLLLLSTLELDRLFIRGEGRDIARVHPPRVRRVDLSTEPSPAGAAQ